MYSELGLEPYRILKKENEKSVKSGRYEKNLTANSRYGSRPNLNLESYTYIRRYSKFNVQIMEMVEKCSDLDLCFISSYLIRRRRKV